MKRLLARAMLFSFAVAGLIVTREAQAEGYVYQAPSYYIVPMATYYPPIYAPQPIVVYEPAYIRPPVAYTPAYVAPAPVVGYYAPAPVRTYESWNSVPWRSRYKYEVKYPGGLEYEYRYKQDGGRIRVSGKWDD